MAGASGKQFAYHALRDTLAWRVERARITGLRPHTLRHTAAPRWLAAGGSEGGLMAVAGWTRPGHAAEVRAGAGRAAGG